MQIGGSGLGLPGMKFFLWSFSIDLNTIQSNYMMDVLSSKCLVTGCKDCRPAIVDPQGTGCLSKGKNQFKNSNSVACLSTTTGCSGSISLECGCDLNSCVLSGTTNLCLCPSSALATSKTCNCPVGQSIRWDVCCESSCLTCLRSDPYTCLTCVDKNAVLDKTGCKCSDKFYGTIPLIFDGSCLKCNSDCSTCNQANLCISCIDSNAILHNVIGCVCKESFYNSSSLTFNGACKKCYNECITCNTIFKCLTCIDANAVPDSLIGCVCKAGFYSVTSLVTNGNCKTCHSDCVTCSSQLKCLTCIEKNAFPHSTVGCQCKGGYYNVTSLNVDGNCKACHPNCATCNSDLKCLSCNDANSLIHSSVGCYCKLGYYNLTSIDSNGNCKACYQECSTCDSPLKCILCKDPIASSDTNIGCKCPSYYYYNNTLLTTVGSCKSCHTHCLTCTSGTTCLKCKDPNAIPSTTGCVCAKGFYKSPSIDLSNNNACQPCFSECETCQESPKCLTCIPKILYLGQTLFVIVILDIDLMHGHYQI